MLEGRNISFSRGGHTLFADLSFSLKKGQLLAIKGINGSGKSTFLRLLSGLLPIQPNTLFWNGEMLSKSTLSPYQQNVLYVGHKLCLYPEARVSDQLRLWQNLYKIPEKRLEAALAFWNISFLKHQRISHLSHGQQKRLSLSRCNWLERSLWILDEPEAGLDQEGKLTLESRLFRHLKDGGCIVHATHEETSQNLEIHL